MIKILVCGAAGRMGKNIISLCENDENIKVIGAFEYDGCAAIGSGNPKIMSIKDFESLLPQADVWVDFTNPQSSLNNLRVAKKYKKACVIGTTGFTDEQKKEIENTAKEMPVLMSPNMSVGVNILFKLVEDVAKRIPDYDVEILELHHNKKKDAPSGTAAKLAEIAANSLNRDINKVGVYERKSVFAPRTKEEIGVVSVRAGDIVGDHTVFFAGCGERLELTHRAHSRDTLASGAIRAAKWIFDKKPGLYNMQDVLGLSDKKK